MKCPNCNCNCEPYMDMSSVGECPQCKGLFTTNSGDDLEIIKMRLE